MKKILSIIQLAARFATIKRAVLNRSGNFENDAEHSYQLALVCWCTNRQYGFGLRDDLLLKFALVHDLVEAYAGDTDSFGDKEKIAAKKENERKALEILKLEFAEHTDMLESIGKYQMLDTVEAQLVNVMDKLMPSINIHDNKDEYCFKRKLDIESWKKWLVNKIRYDTLDSRLKVLVDESIKEVAANYSGIFYSQSLSG